MIKTYFSLTKPGIIFGNLITAAAGFILASKNHFNGWIFFATLIGLAFVIASACVFNNYIDRLHDEKMERTKNRALVKGIISPKNALVFASFLILFGTLTLSWFTNLLTLCVALTGFLVYVFLYSSWKYRSMHATLIGSISGGIPPVAGYCAVSNTVDVGAFLLFMIVVLWQMPHFFAIALYRLDDYVAAAIPVLPVKKSMQVTKIHMLLYIISFSLITPMLTLFGYTGYLYLIVSSLLALTWLWLCIKGFKSNDNKVWARKMFVFSLVIITVVSGMISLDG